MARRRYEFGVGLLLLVALGVLGFMAMQLGSFRSLGPQLHGVIPMEDAAGITSGAVVSVAGVPVGYVDKIALDGGVAMVHIALDASAGIRRDAVAKVRARSILGEKYIQLQPLSVTAPLFQEGDALSIVGAVTEIDEMVNALGPVVEAVDPVVIGRVLASLQDALDNDPDVLKRILTNLDDTLSNGAEASKELRVLLSSGKDTLATTQSAMAGVDGTAKDASQFIAQGEQLMNTLQEASEDLPELVSELRKATEEARGVISDGSQVSGDLKSLLSRLSALSDEDIRRLVQDEGVRIRFRPRKKAK